MPLFKPNQDCLLRRRVERNVYAEEVLGPPIKTRCTIVSLDVRIESSSLRADTSATKGNAREMIAEGKVLLPPDALARVNDQLEVDGFKLRIVGLLPRRDIAGNLDHLQATVSMWGKE